MPRGDRKVRMVFYLDQAAAGRCIQLSRKYGATRSEAARLALEAGLDQIVPTLRQLYSDRLERAPLAVGAAASGAPPASSLDASEQLREYALTLRQMAGPKAPAELRVLLTAQAKVLPVPVTELEDVVEEVISSIPDGQPSGASSTAAVNPHESPD